MMGDSSIVQPLISRTPASLKPLPPLNTERPGQSSSSPDPIQLLAMQMEQARAKLARLLMQNAFGFDVLIERIERNPNPGMEGVDIAQCKSSDHYTVQADRFVQPVCDESMGATHEMESGDNEEIHRVDRESLSHVHLLPAFLIEVSRQVLQTMPVDQAEDRIYKQQLSRCQQHLNSLRQQMIVNNTGLVAFVARKQQTMHLSHDDVMQEGVIGLIKAVDRFDPGRGIRFSTYAIFWIKQAISRLIVKQEKTVRLPVALAEKASAVLEVIRNSYLENERWPTWQELQGQSSLSEAEIKILINYYQSTLSLDASLDEDDDDLTLMAHMKQQQFALPLNALIDQGLTHYIEQLIAALPEKEALVLTWRFGLKNHAEMTLQAVADQMQVTRERVRQIQNEALKKLKQQFGYELKLFLEANES